MMHWGPLFPWALIDLENFILLSHNVGTDMRIKRTSHRCSY